MITFNDRGNFLIMSLAYIKIIEKCVVINRIIIVICYCPADSCSINDNSVIKRPL